MKPKYVVIFVIATMAVMLLMGMLIVGLVIGRTLAANQSSTASIPMPAKFITPQAEKSNIVDDIVSAVLPDDTCEVPGNMKALVEFDDKNDHHAMVILNITEYGWVVSVEAVTRTGHNVRDYLNPSEQLKEKIELLGFTYWAGPEQSVIVEYPRGGTCKIETPAQFAY